MRRLFKARNAESSQPEAAPHLQPLTHLQVPGAPLHRGRSMPPRPPALRSPVPPTHQPQQPRAPDKARRPRLDWRSLAMLSAGVLIAFVVMLAFSTFGPHQPPLSEGDVRQLAAQVMASATPPPPVAARVYDAIAPSVVLIHVQIDKDGKTDEVTGSGVVVDTGGDILTNLHVVQGATDIEVIFADGSTSKATLAGQLGDKDIAVVKVETPPAMGLIPAVLGNPAALHVGDTAVVVGNPFGLRHTVTAGVISGLDRSFKLPSTDQPVDGLIQFDAAVNPGNSGGPLLNSDGEVVGIVTALANPTDQSVFIGIGFAVPIDVAANAAGAPPF